MMSSSKRLKLASAAVIDRFLANGDVWQVIFEMLSVKGRIRLEMTNKRLRTMIFEYWKRLTSFDIECLTSGNPSMRKKRKKLSAALLASICIDRIGDALRSLTISEKYFPITLWSGNLHSIAKACPNVETMNFVYERWGRTLDIRLDSFSRLKTLTVSAAGGYFISASASIFLSIPASIEVIRGLGGKREEPFENAAQMEGFFADRRSLRELCLCCLATRDWSKADMFRVIAQRCPHLKSIALFDSSGIDYSGVVALDEMKELRMPHVFLDEMEIVTICERSPLVEALEFCFRFSSNPCLQLAALNALGALTKLSELALSIHSTDVVASSLVTEFVREIARNSGASLRRVEMDEQMVLSTAAIDALANGCPKLRSLKFFVRVGEATPASIRFLIDCIVADPSWIPQTDQPTLDILLRVLHDGNDEGKAGNAAFEALAAPAANLPARVMLDIWSTCCT